MVKCQSNCISTSWIFNNLVIKYNLSSAKCKGVRPYNFEWNKTRYVPLI